MALLVKQVKRFEHPDEPGEWFDLRVPLTAGDMKEMGDAANIAVVKFLGVARSLVAWSYAAPVSTESVEQLDAHTFNWLTEKVFEAAGIRSDEEKNASGASLPPTTEQAAAPSPLSSGT